MADTGKPPVIPVEFQQYNSYVIDPEWQRRFSMIWPSVLGVFVVCSLPHLLRSVKRGRTPTLGISESYLGYADEVNTDQRIRPPQPYHARSFLTRAGLWIQKVAAISYLTVPWIDISVGQATLIIGYAAVVVLCTVLDANLVTNSNRAGFMALAQLPVVFVFATKNSFVSMLLGPGNGYEKLNFLHRWSGRFLYFCALVHGGLWIQNHRKFGLPILGEPQETTGIAAFSLLSLIFLGSLRPIRQLYYQIFYFVHSLLFVAFYIMVTYHTIYAAPWVFAPVALYGLDIILRMFRHRVKDAILVPVDNQMTLIHVPHATSGWIAGQHVRLRVFFEGRFFESHPLTISTATPGVSCVTSFPPGITFGARVCGDWTKALNDYAHSAITSEITKEEKNPLCEREVPTQVMIDGPYGGCSIDLGDYESVLLFSGGSGITFALGLLDDIVGRCVKRNRNLGEKTRRIELSWCLRSFGTIQWFADALMDIARTAARSSTSPIPIDLHITIYVTCLCDPEAVPPIPNCDVVMTRPSIYRVLTGLASPPPTAVEKGRIGAACISKVKAAVDVLPDAEELDINPSAKLAWHGYGGGIAVCASGPEDLTRSAANAVARFQLSQRGTAAGSIGFHSEKFAL